MTAGIEAVAGIGAAAGTGGADLASGHRDMSGPRDLTVGDFAVQHMCGSNCNRCFTGACCGNTPPGRTTPRNLLPDSGRHAGTRRSVPCCPRPWP